VLGVVLIAIVAFVAMMLITTASGSSRGDPGGYLIALSLVIALAIGYGGFRVILVTLGDIHQGAVSSYFGPFIMIICALGVLAVLFVPTPGIGIDVLVSAAFGFGFTMLLVYFPTVVLYSEWKLLGVGLFWGIWTISLGFAFWSSFQKERQAKNPLQGLFDK
jgi:hypothetical protein